MPIICIGESKEDRDAGRTEEAIHKQLQILLDEVNIHKVIPVPIDHTGS
ncbi:triose-phosphate isomerase [Mycoplasmopsis bovis]